MIALASGKRAGKPNPVTDNVNEGEPSAIAVLLLAIFVRALTAATDGLLAFPRRMLEWGDAVGHAAVADFIFAGEFSNLEGNPLYWLTPTVAAGARLLLPVSSPVALALVSFVASLVAVFLVHRLWGGWVASVFAFAEVEWLQRSVLGGPEPLCMATLFGAFYAWRKGYWKSAAVLASLATCTRPLAAFALIAAGLVFLLSRRDYRRFTTTTLISIAVVIAFVYPFHEAFRDIPDLLGRFNRNGDGQHYNLRFPLTLPFVALATGMLHHEGTFIRFIYSAVWLMYLIFSLGVWARRTELHQLARQYPVEWIYAGLYVLLMVCLNGTGVAGQHSQWVYLPRGLTMVLPFLLTTTVQWLPRRQSVLWSVAAFMGVFAGASAANLAHAASVVHRFLGG